MSEKGFDLSCPRPLTRYQQVQMAHGGGGSLMNRLIEEVFLSTFRNVSVNEAHDASVVELPGTRTAMTTDSFVVKPLFFPGGDIGSLAVHGTVNDLAMAGATPVALTAGFILEEGLEIAALEKIAQSMADAATLIGVKVVAGDTKVVERGKGDGCYINTSGVGVIKHNLVVHPKSVKAGQAIILSGDIGRHGIAVMASREGLEFGSDVQSDSASVVHLALGLVEAGIKVACMRDCTRGGLSSALNEIAKASGMTIRINEADIPIDSGVSSACEILGFDPLYVACEGRFVAFVESEQAELAAETMRLKPGGEQSALIGYVEEGEPRVVIRNTLGTNRIVPMLSGEQLPRIC